MLGWMLYATVVSALLGAAAWAAEWSAETRRAPARLYWALAIMASLLLPVMIASVSVQVPSLSGGAIERAAPAAAIPLRQMTSSALAPAQWLDRVPVAPNLDELLIAAWAVASGVLAAGIIVHGLLLQRNKARWATARVAGVEVFVSETVGPAIVGLMQPRIVVPRWIVTASPEDQALIIAHERTHLDADDARLLAVAILLMVCMPWNVPLWWQLRRLRQAIEVDCDARVLRGGGDMTRYGETLLMVGARHSSNLAVVAAMSEPRSNLEQRLRKMLSSPARFAWASGAALAALSLVLAASAAEVSPPNRNAAPGDLIVDAATLDRYVGFYDMQHLAVLSVTRKGTQLSFQVTGQQATLVYPRTDADFIWGNAGNIGVRFITKAGGNATSAVLHQYGVADQVMPRTTEAIAMQFKSNLLVRIESQSPTPGTKAVLAHVIAAMLVGKPDYSQMEPALAQGVREQFPPARAILSSLGPVQNIAFSGVGAAGNDVYIVRHAHGVSRWTIGVGTDGKIYALKTTPWP